MAREEQDREDLLREATALVERAEFRVDEFDQPIVAGFRTSGAGCVYFGADPVLQFNSAGQLRRAFRDGYLYKADQHRLARLQRARDEKQTTLLRRDLNDEQQMEFLQFAEGYLRRLSAGLELRKYQLVGQVPNDVDVMRRIRSWVGELPRPLSVAAAPNAK